MELADYLTFFERQYSKAFLIYKELERWRDDVTPLGMSIGIGRLITEFLQNRRYTQGLLNGALQLKKGVKAM